MAQVNYIIGIGRSGTSLLMSLLGSHPDIHTPPENYFSVFFAKSLSNKRNFSQKEINLIHRFNIAFGKLQPYVGFEYKLPENVLKNGFNGTYLELCTIIYSSFKHLPFPCKKPLIYIDKNPSNTLFINQIQSFNPDAKYILMVRDYRANILSRKESIHLLSPKIAFNAIRWNYFNKKALHWKNKHPDRVMVVRYEDLVENPDISLKNIFSFLGVNPILSEELQLKEREGYKKYKEDAKIKKSVRAKKKYEDLSMPIFKHRLTQWQENLSTSEIRIAEIICGKTGRILNYQTTNKMNPMNRIFVCLRYSVLALKINLLFLKDHFFHYLPIEFKVRRFEKYIERINQKRIQLK